MSIKFNYKKLLANLFKYTLSLVLLAGIAWGGYELYMSWTNIPFNVRVTNITARSATVSWLTDQPTKGSIAYSDSTDMGFMNYQALTAYDDRDTANALSEVIDGIDLSGDEVDFPDVSDVKVSKMGEFYVHHVTVTGLEPEEEYFFKVNSGVRSWTEDMVGIDTGRNSQGVINEQDFKTTAALNSVPAPSPAYGKIISLSENEDGELIERDSLDAVVFYWVEDMSSEDGRESGLLSSVTNDTGGWYIDRANLRYADNELFEVELGNDMAYIFSNIENIRNGYDYMLLTGVDDAPAPDVLGSIEDEEEISALSELLISLESAVSAGNPPDGCDTSVCYNGAYWKESGGKCKKHKSCGATKPGEGAGGNTKKYPGDDGGVTYEGDCYPGALGYGTKSSREHTLTCKDEAGYNAKVYRYDDCSLGCTPTKGGGGGQPDPKPTDPGDDDVEETVDDPIVSCCISSREEDKTLKVKLSMCTKWGTKGACPATPATLGWCCTKPTASSTRAISTYVREDQCTGSLSTPGKCADNPDVIDITDIDVKDSCGACHESATDLEFTYDSDTGAFDDIVDFLDESDDSNSGTIYASSSVLGVSTAQATVQEDGKVIFPESGIYEVSIGGEEITVIAFEDKPSVFYKEDNDIAGYQEGEDTLITFTGVQLDVKKKASSQTLSFKKGINLFSLPFLPLGADEKGMSAYSLLDIANVGNLKISSLSFFESGAWQSGLSVDYTDNGAVRGRDFDLLPGRGYVLIANKDFSIDIPGKDLKAGVPVALNAGWNLTGINGFTETYTARTLIKSINELDALTADNVTWWPTSKGRYEGFQVSEGTEYGFDYPISNDLGYFIRISDFSPTDPLTKSIIWGPGTDLHGKPGSTN